MCIIYMILVFHFLECCNSVTPVLAPCKYVVCIFSKIKKKKLTNITVNFSSMLRDVKGLQL